MKDQIVAANAWEFNDEVVGVFDDMLSRSIPAYEEMRATVLMMIEPLITDGGFVLDIGCSHGEMIDRMMKKFGSSLHVSYVGIDSSTAMVKKARARFSENESVTIFHGDLSNADMTRLRYDAVLSILTLQFVPIEHRQRILKSIYRSITAGGCFILVEKVLGETSSGQDHLVDVYYQMKRNNGYTDEQIEAKRVSLQNVLVPLRASENIRLLKEAGFSVVEPFWQNLNFMGIYAAKEK